jgi:competence protein ComEA
MKRLLLALFMLLASSFALAAVNINTATKEELDALPGIGPVKAQAIIDYRNANGPFKSPQDVMKVRGIKEGEFGKIRDQISVSGATTLPSQAAKNETPRTPASRTPSVAHAAPAAPTAAPAATANGAAATAAPATKEAGSTKMTRAEERAAKAKAREEKAAKAREEKAAKAEKAKEEKMAKAEARKSKAKSTSTTSSNTKQEEKAKQ